MVSRFGGGAYTKVVRRWCRVPGKGLFNGVDDIVVVVVVVVVVGERDDGYVATNFAPRVRERSDHLQRRVSSAAEKTRGRVERFAKAMAGRIRPRDSTETRRERERVREDASRTRRTTTRKARGVRGQNGRETTNATTQLRETNETPRSHGTQVEAKDGGDRTAKPVAQRRAVRGSGEVDRSRTVGEEDREGIE